ncbi:MAG TPA: hypothetical protein VK971_02140 [Thiohalobacter sp.]|nr:hypothetical protein [Thiohalobacter sp.]
MADNTYTPLVYTKQGGSELVVASGGKINVESGGKITADGTQASNIAAITTTGTFSTGICAKIEAIRAAVEGVGITATS